MNREAEGCRPDRNRGAELLEESLRQCELAFIEFRDSSVGRQAFVKGTRLAVWQVAALARSFGEDGVRIADHLEILAVAVAAALRYAAAYPAEVGAAIADNDRSAEELARLIPDLDVVTIDRPAP